MAYATKVITTIDDVPADYVPARDFNAQFPHIKRGTLQKMISDAHMLGHIRAVKLVRTLGDLKTGRVFVHRDDTRQFLEAHYRRQAEWAAASRTVVAPPPAPVASGELPGLLAAIRTLTVAVENLTAAVELKSEAMCVDACRGEEYATR
jgi:hypothetical protein